MERLMQKANLPESANRPISVYTATIWQAMIDAALQEQP
jgi:hypothetical protein